MTRRAIVNGSWTPLPDWRPWPDDDPRRKSGPGRKSFVRARASVGLTAEQRGALEDARNSSKLPMSEIIRRCLARGGILS